MTDAGGHPISFTVTGFEQRLHYHSKQTANLSMAAQLSFGNMPPN